MKKTILKLFLVFSLVLVIISYEPVQAMSAKQKQILDYNINYYNDCVEGASGGGSGVSSNQDVLRFAAFPIGSTWNLSDDKVEEWFLGTGTAAIGKFGLNADNIGEITQAVKDAGVSPAFFYGYTVNEGGGAGGFINHYAYDAAGGGVANAKKDAEYLVNQANSENSRPAVGGGEPASMPTAEAQSFLDSLPLGSIGKVYIPATSAATAEIEEYYGKFDTSTTRFGKPIAGLMDYIEDMGGDPMDPGVDVAAGPSAGMATCNSEAAGTVNERIVQIANEWGSWGETYSTCYVFGGMHGASQAELDEAIENHFTPSKYGIDCSGFASAVIYKATGIFKMWSTTSMCSDTENFEEVTDPQPGDFSINCNSHVAVILEVNSDGTFKTAESTDSGCGKRNGPHYGSYKGEKVLRYIGDSNL